MYCVKCKKITDTSNIQNTVSKNGRNMKRGTCMICGTTKTHIDKIWAADLVDMQAFSKFNRGLKYLLTVIDVFSKYGWLIPLKDKTGKSVASALKTIFEERKPEKCG